jgi:hypothetical protein
MNPKCRTNMADVLPLFKRKNKFLFNSNNKFIFGISVLVLYNNTGQ